MSAPEIRWDIFLSYAREERAWVERYLYEPLLKYRTADGRRPQIFFDVEALDAAVNWLTALAQAIQASRKAVLVYSRNYFSKPMTNWELTKLIQRDPTGEHRLINPILIDPQDADRVPFTVSHINYLTERTPDWFTRLVRALELKPAVEEVRLQFRTQPENGIVNQTLFPAVEVALQSASGGVPRDEEVTLSTETPGLLGTLKVRSHNGIAVFRDLLFDRECTQAELVAWVEGCEKVKSRPLKIGPAVPPEVEPPALPPGAEIGLLPSAEASVPSDPILPGAGEAVFFANGAAVALVSDQVLAVYSTAGQLLGQFPWGGSLRLSRRSGANLVLATWQGQVHLLRADGSHCSWNLADPQGGFAVIGDVTLAEDQVYVGLWNGRLYRLAFGNPPVPLPSYEAGIQALTLVGGTLFVAGLDGQCTLFRGGARIAEYRLEPALFLLKPSREGTLALGSRHLYLIPSTPRSTGQVYQDPLQMTSVSWVWAESDDLLVIDDRGKGVRINPQCIQRAFHVSAGATPTSASNDGRYCVFRNPDQSHALLHGDRVVFTHPAGALAVSPRADLFAVGDGQTVRLLKVADFATRIPGGNR